MSGTDPPTTRDPSAARLDRGLTPARLQLLAGPVGVAVSAVAIFGSVLLAPWFTWTGHALSNLGEVGRATAPLFNGGLVLTGLLGLAFTRRVWAAATNAVHRLGTALLAVGFAASGLVGVFPTPQPLHGPVAVTFFVAFTLGLVAFGSGDALAGRGRRGVVAVWLAVAHVLGWGLLAVVPFDGIAIPELIGVMALWAWVLLLYGSLRP